MTITHQTTAHKTTNSVRGVSSKTASAGTSLKIDKKSSPKKAPHSHESMNEALKEEFIKMNAALAQSKATVDKNEAVDANVGYSHTVDNTDPKHFSFVASLLDAPTKAPSENVLSVCMGDNAQKLVLELAAITVQSYQNYMDEINTLIKIPEKLSFTLWNVYTSAIESHAEAQQKKLDDQVQSAIESAKKAAKCGIAGGVAEAFAGCLVMALGISATAASGGALFGLAVLGVASGAFMVADGCTKVYENGKLLSKTEEMSIDESSPKAKHDSLQLIFRDVEKFLNENSAYIQHGIFGAMAGGDNNKAELGETIFDSLSMLIMAATGIGEASTVAVEMSKEAGEMTMKIIQSIMMKLLNSSLMFAGIIGNIVHRYGGGKTADIGDHKRIIDFWSALSLGYVGIGLYNIDQAGGGGQPWSDHATLGDQLYAKSPYLYAVMTTLFMLVGSVISVWLEKRMVYPEYFGALEKNQILTKVREIGHSFSFQTLASQSTKGITQSIQNLFRALQNGVDMESNAEIRKLQEEMQIIASTMEAMTKDNTRLINLLSKNGMNSASQNLGQFFSNLQQMIISNGRAVQNAYN